MENPCRECLIQVTCSCLCWNKKNFIRLINHAMEEYQHELATTKHQKKLVVLFNKLHMENIKDEQIICNRKLQRAEL